MAQNITFDLLSNKLNQTEHYFKDAQKDFKEYKKTDKSTTLFLETSPNELITVKVITESNASFEKIIRALQDLSFLRKITPALEEWVIVDKNVRFELHHCKTKAYTDMIFAEIKQISNDLAYFTSTSVDHPTAVIEKERTVTKYILNSTIVEKLNENKSKLTWILCQNISRFDVAANNKLMLEQVPSYLEQLSKELEQYPY